jgi:osmotically-inducible protein OsmY
MTASPAEPDTIAAAARAALARTGYAWLQRVAVAAEAGALVLRGEVPSFYLKQLAQATVLALPGVPGVRNELRVGRGA